MQTEQIAQVQEIGPNLFGLSKEERAAYLRVATTDSAVRKELERRLSLIEAALGDGIGTPFWMAATIGSPVPLPQIQSDEPALPPAVSERSQELQVGENLGPYRLIRQLGAGGMGTVYEAEQSEPIRRRVALKLIRSGRESASVVLRFLRERQALALMEHPGIARVFDAGYSPYGQPYFVMELVEGTPLTVYCDRNRFSLRRRLLLFGELCAAVQHAHQKGMIHRDLKPSNVLVAEVDSRPVVKVIDFGVAKAIDPGLEGPTLTVHGAPIGTPAYMSPEQMGLGGRDTDTRSDVYALGVMLYEILVGVLPWDAAPKEKRDELWARKIEPLMPSDCLEFLGEERRELARNRRMEPWTLRRLLRGDLDHITLKAMASERRERYGGVSDLAQDVTRYLEDEPVRARPPSTSYRLWKLVRRYRLTASLILAVTISLLVGLIQAHRAEQRATREAAAAGAVSGFLVEMFEESDPYRADDQRRRGVELTAKDILDRGAERLKSLAEQPSIQARLMTTVGKVYSTLGHFDEAEGLLSRAMAVRRRLRKEPPRDLATTLGDLGGVYRAQGRYREAEVIFRESLDLYESDLDSNDVRVGDALRELGWLTSHQGNYQAAEPLLLRAIDIYESALGYDDPTIAMALMPLASIYTSQEDFEKAEPLHARILQLYETAFGADHPRVAQALNGWGWVELAWGRYEKAERLFYRALSIQEAALGGEHLDVAGSLHNLGVIRLRQGSYKESRRFFERALEIREAMLGPDHREVAETLNNLTRLFTELGELDRAEGVGNRTLAILELALGRDHTRLTPTLANLALLYRKQGRPAAVETTLNRMSILTNSVYGPEHSHNAFYLVHQAWVAGQGGEYDEAKALLAEALAIYQRAFGDEHVEVAWTLENQAELAISRGEFAVAEPLLNRVLDSYRTSLGSEHPDLVEPLINLARIALERSDYSGAKVLCEQALTVALGEFAEHHPAVVELRAIDAELNAARSQN